MGNKATTKHKRQQLEADLHKLIDRSQRWQIKLAIDKCKVLHFDSKIEDKLLHELCYTT